MRSSVLLSALAAVVPIYAEEINASDVPAACTAICAPVVSLTNICDIDPKAGKLRLRDDDDAQETAQEAAEEATEANCICTNKSFDVAGVMALCASCITQNNGDTEDVNKIMAQCSFASTSYLPSATAIVQGIQVDATKPSTTGAATGAAAATNSPSAASKERNAAGILGLGMAGLGIIALGQ